MWIFTPIGFFSVVQKAGANCLTVRSRVRSDIDQLRRNYLPELSETTVNSGTDYPYRASVPHVDFAAAMSRMAKALDYANFKDEVAHRQGHRRAHVYGRVWQELLALEAPEESLSESAATKAVSFGGVAFDESGRVLLIEPKGHFDGYAWTFPKGRPKDGESPGKAAEREFEEETGLIGIAVADVPGHYAGGTTINQYFLMRISPVVFIKKSGAAGGETASIRWASYAEARSLIRMTRNPIGMKRDLAVLDAAYLAWQRLRMEQHRRIEEREPTTSASWTVVPFDGQTTCLDIDWRFSNGEYDQISRGHLPPAMEDKWFLFVECNALFACRSWTGKTILRVPFARDGTHGWRANTIEIPEKMLDSQGREHWIDLLWFLIQRILLGRNVPPPGFTGTPEEAAVKAWHELGPTA